MEASKAFEEEKKPKADLQVVDHASIAMAEAAKARVQAAYIMALKKPRNVDESRIRILEACKRPAFAERVKYKKPVGTKIIRGPSIRFAESALRIWENILVDTQVVYEDENIKRSKIMCIDLETNTQFSKEISIEKTVERKSAKDRDVLKSRINSSGEKVFVVRATEDEVHNKESALISKAIRNEGLRLIPSDIVDEALEIAEETIRHQDAIDPAAAKKKILDAFVGIGVYPKDIEKYLCHKIDTVSPAELQDLREMYRAINDGEATWQSYIEIRDNAGNDKPPAKPGEATEKAKDNLRKEREAANGKPLADEAEAPESPNADVQKEIAAINSVLDALGITEEQFAAVRAREGWDNLPPEEGHRAEVDWSKRRPSLGSIKTLRQIVEKLGKSESDAIGWLNEKTGMAYSYLWEFTGQQIQDAVSHFLQLKKK